MGIMILAAQSAPESESGTHILIAMADQLGLLLSPVFKELFLIGVWAAVFSSMLGVWQGVPYIFTDSTAQWRSKLSKIDSSDKGYRLALLYIAPTTHRSTLFGQTGMANYFIFRHRRVIHAVFGTDTALLKQPHYQA